MESLVWIVLEVRKFVNVCNEFCGILKNVIEKLDLK